MTELFLTLDAILKSPVEKFELGIGECFFTNTPMLIRTVLGSCVCVTFHHAPSHFAGAFHAVMPEADSIFETRSCKFVDTAISSMVSRFAEHGISFDEINVKLFGGSNTFSATNQTTTQKLLDVGMKNVATAKARLKDYGCRLRAQDVCGDVGRTLYFHTGSGEVWVRKHKPSLAKRLASASAEDSFRQLPMKNGECRQVDTR